MGQRTWRRAKIGSGILFEKTDEHVSVLARFNLCFTLVKKHLTILY